MLDSLSELEDEDVVELLEEVEGALALPFPFDRCFLRRSFFFSSFDFILDLDLGILTFDALKTGRSTRFMTPKLWKWKNLGLIALYHWF